ncbi:MAG: hypothetical protein AAF170_18245 [Bacteroidota bacterium]
MTERTQVSIAGWIVGLGLFVLVLFLGSALRGCFDSTPDPEIEQIRQERDAALARADRFEAQSAANADSAFIYRQIANGLAPVVHDLLASREEALTEVAAGEGERARLTSDLSIARRQLNATRQVAQEAPDSLPAARDALSACYDTLSACDAVREQQGRLLTVKDTVIARGDCAIVALQSQTAALDSTAGYYQSAYTGLLSGYSEQGRALQLYGEETAILSRRVTIRTRQRDAALVGLGIATLAALLK